MKTFDSASAPRRRNRNRKACIRLDQVVTDGAGNIVNMPLTNSLHCFGNPVEYYRGEFDETSKWRRLDGTITEQPSGCAGCKSRAACGAISIERIGSGIDVTRAFQSWENETARLSREARYSHRTFEAFADACEKAAWTTSNDERLAEKRAADAARKRRERLAERRRARRGKPITEKFLSALDHEFDIRRASLTVAVRAPGAAPWLRNLTDRSISLTCDVWRANAHLSRQYRGEISAGDIVKHLTASNKCYGLPISSLRSRVREANRRICRLEEDGSVSGWHAFDYLDADSPRSPGREMNGVKGRYNDCVVLEILDS